MINKNDNYKLERALRCHLCKKLIFAIDTKLGFYKKFYKHYYCQHGWDFQQFSGVYLRHSVGNDITLSKKSSKDEFDFFCRLFKKLKRENIRGDKYGNLY